VCLVNRHSYVINDVESVCGVGREEWCGVRTVCVCTSANQITPRQRKRHAAAAFLNNEGNKDDQHTKPTPTTSSAAYHTCWHATRGGHRHGTDTGQKRVATSVCSRVRTPRLSAPKQAARSAQQQAIAVGCGGGTTGATRTLTKSLGALTTAAAAALDIVKESVPSVESLLWLTPPSTSGYVFLILRWRCMT
jgi:hypothetical protein